MDMNQGIGRSDDPITARIDDDTSQSGSLRPGRYCSLQRRALRQLRAMSVLMFANAAVFLVIAAITLIEGRSASAYAATALASLALGWVIDLDRRIRQMTIDVLAAVEATRRQHG